jgi:uncharacterized protein HemX
MKAIRMLLALFLAMASMVFVNAQNSTSNHRATVSTGADCDPVCAMQRKLDSTNRKVNKIQGQVKQLKNRQANLDQKVTGIDARETANHATLDNTIKTVDELNSKTVPGLTDRVSGLSNTMRTLVIVAVVILLVGGGCIVWYMKGLKRIVQQNEKDIDETRSVKEIVIINPNRAYLLSLWSSSEGKSPEERTIHFTERLTENNEKGHNLGGNVSGYTAIFEDGKDFPIVRYRGGKAMKLRDVPRHAADILRLQPQQVAEDPSAE